MFYLLYLYYADIAHQYPLLNLVQYQTVRMALALATAMIVAVAMGSRFINWIRAKQGRGQPIRDDGPGYPPHLLGRLGEPYLTTRRQGTEGPDGYEGMGLGLFIGRTLLERSGGRVSFANHNGAVARVSWPEAALLADDRAVLRPNPAISD